MERTGPDRASAGADARRGGMTLIEVLLAVFVLGVCLVGIMEGMAQCMEVFRAAGVVGEAGNVLARGDAEHPFYVKNDPVEDLSVSADTGLLDGWTYEREVEDDEDEDGLYVVTTTVRKGRGGPGNQLVVTRLLHFSGGTGGSGASDSARSGEGAGR